MKEFRSIGTICVKDEYDILYAVCEIEYVLKEDESFIYYFRPNYHIINLLNSSLFQGIPGLNLDLKKDVYIRENMVPTFISERVPSSSREDYNELLEEVEMDYMDPIEYLIRTRKQYFGDNFYVRPFKEKVIKEIDFNTKQTNTEIIKDIIESIAAGNDVLINGELIKDNNRKVFYTIFYSLYKRSVETKKQKQKAGIIKAKEEKKYIGRKPIEVNYLQFLVVEEKVFKREMTVKEAAKNLKISVDKYYRYRKELQNKNYTLLQ